MSKEWRLTLFSGLHMDAHIFEYAPTYMNMYTCVCKHTLRYTDVIIHTFVPLAKDRRKFFLMTE